MSFWKWYRWSWGVLGFSFLTSALIVGCTVTPRTVKPIVASFDGTNQNSGIIEFTSDGCIITAHKRDRYNALIDVYGTEFQPALRHDAGLKPAPGGNWVIDSEHLVDLLDMEQWRRSKPR